ncbi:MAG: hypothetical protein ACQ9ET_00095 [Nitrosomonadaceae bacterium]
MDTYKAHRSFFAERTIANQVFRALNRGRHGKVSPKNSHTRDKERNKEDLQVWVVTIYHEALKPQIDSIIDEVAQGGWS